jgi:dipeptidyl aminopeptidase/acylaminoacyl peptidase
MDMNLGRLVLPAFCLALAAATGRADEAHPSGASIDAYGHLPSIEDVALSADGSRVALVHTVGDQRLLSVIIPDQNKLLGGLRLGDTKLRGLEWADDHQVMLTSASTAMPWGLIGTKVEWRLMQIYDSDAKQVHSLLQHVRGDKRMMNVVYERPVIAGLAKEPSLFLHGLYVDEQTEPALIRVNLHTGAETLVKAGNSDTRFWMVNDQGEIVAEEEYSDEKHRWTIRLMKDGRTQQTVGGIAPLDFPEILGLNADNSALVVSVHEDEGITWKLLSLKDGSWGEDIAPNERLTGLILDAGSQRMIGTADVDDTVRYHFIDPAVQRGWDWIERLFYKERVEYLAISADHSRFLVEVFGPTSGYAYFLIDANEHFKRRVGSVYDDVDKIAEVRAITYPAADGLKIGAYLTLPPGRGEKNLPLIVMPHGGPQARDTLGFDWWAQALAAQGYAVLQPNYRGSALGRAWTERGYGEWGRKMQSDLSDGLRYLAKAGIADPQRACIVGASYGGYAALAGMTLESGTYRCGVSVAGISDPAAMLRWVRNATGSRDSETQRYWDRFMGVDGPADKRLDEISPIKHADRVAAPVMLIHGKEDTVVPYDQSNDMFKALKKLGKPVEFVPLNKEDHHLSRSETRLQMLRTSIEFLKKYNPPDPP